MQQERCVVRHDVCEVGFGVYSEEEVLKLSVVRIRTPATYDRLGNPLQGGLYDPSMGPVDARSICVTCGLSMRDCPGHMGHLLLSLHVYNPLMLGTVFQALRVKCFGCHGFRLSPFPCRLLALKLALLDAGQVAEAEGLEQRLLAAENREAVLRGTEQRVKALPEAQWVSGEVKARRRALVKEFLSDVLHCKTCDRCGAPKAAVRKDGFTKFFLRGGTGRRGAASGTRPQSALARVRNAEGDLDPAEEGGDDSSEEEEDEEAVEGGAGQGRQQRGAATKGGGRGRGGGGDKYMPPVEVQMHMKLLWEAEPELATLIWGKAAAKAGHGGRAVAAVAAAADAAAAAAAERPPAWQADRTGWRSFFWRVLPIAPSRFRPPSRNDDGSMAEHAQNYNIIKVMQLDERIRSLLKEEGGANGPGAEGGDWEEGGGDAMVQMSPEALSRVLSTWIDLQNAVNGYIDSSKEANARLGGNNITPGIRQGLEKKEGLFRMHMMGKRVNFACRSVISPDPYLGTSEIGLPVRFARVLTYPQPVTPWNVEQLRALVENGPDTYPGANYIEDAKGRLVDLRRMDANRRKAFAARLLTPPGQKVWRHLHDGDVVLMNRQPTLHKPGIMAHHARVLRNPGQQTIRMHYANCNTYNADFDGDEMNCHFPQDELSRAEAETIVCTNEQYIVPTNGKPLRGLIQDHVGSGVKLTGKDCFLTRADFQHLLFCTLSGLPGVEIVKPSGRIQMPAPSLWKPMPLWTGKQLVSAVLRHLTAGLPALNLDFRAKTPAAAFGAEQEEHEVVVRGGELLRGVLDKAAFGASEGGLVHGVYEFYGAHFAGRLLTALGRLLTVYLQLAGHTCSIEDLVLTPEAEGRRRALIRRAAQLGGLAMDCYTAGRAFEPPPPGQEQEQRLGVAALARVRARTAELLEEDVRTGAVAQGAGIDNFMRTVLAPLSSGIIRACLPDGLATPFPHNAFSLMVSTGAKGSTVNQSQVSCGLGQQELEGRRVPLMPSGKSLPSFPPHDPSPRAGGYIVDRFLTGVRPQEYYFHCMAGREGLIDTAVKTSRSGYLQRCLVKGLEELRVHYDHTVRDADAGVVQFLYGEDGVDPVHSRFLNGQDPQMTALARNHAALLHQYRIDSGFLRRTGMEMSTARAMHAQVQAGRRQQRQAATAAAGAAGGEGQEPTLAEGAVVLAKRLKRGRSEWMAGGWRDGWVPAEVVKVHQPKSSSNSSSSRKKKFPSYDLRYEDGSVAKRVPRRVALEVKEAGGQPSQSAALVEVIRWPYLPEPVLGRAQLGLHVGAVSERFQDAVREYLDQDPEGIMGRGGGGSSSGGGGAGEKRASLELLLWLKYLRSLAAPGEAVGSIAGQSIGEPSTQMTLNTFHLAGHGGANVTLGIPRLREIIMTASQSIKTPSMTVKLQPGVGRAEAQRLAARLRRLQLRELVHHEQGGVTVAERLGRVGNGDEDGWLRFYTVQLRLYEERWLEAAFGLSHAQVFEAAGASFVKLLLGMVTAELRKVASREEVLLAFKQQRDRQGRAPAGGEGADEADEEEADLEELSEARKGKVAKGRSKGTADDEDEDEDEEEEEDGDEEAQGTLKFGRKEERGEYEADEPVEEEQEEEEERESESGDEEAKGGSSGDDKPSNGGGKPGKRRRLSNGLSASSSSSSSSSSSPGAAGAGPAKIEHPFLEDVAFRPEVDVLQVTLKMRASHRRLLMVTLAEAAAERCTVRASRGISQAFVVEDRAAGGAGSIQTEGCNLQELWDVGEGLLQLGSITSNDVWAIHQAYGVEAARATVVQEIKGVFGAYGIAVDPRHLGLVADFMTYQGGFRALNRMGMAQVSSPFLQMSFETTAAFLTEAALAAERDNLETPSAKLVMGQPTGNGTGCFDLMVPADAATWTRARRKQKTTRGDGARGAATEMGIC